MSSSANVTVNELEVRCWRGVTASALAMVICASGCGAPEPEAEEQVVESEPLLASFPSYGNNIQTCFTQTVSSWANLHADARSVFDRLQESWGSIAKINFGPTVNKPDMFATGCSTGALKVTLYKADSVSSSFGTLQLIGKKTDNTSGLTGSFGVHHVPHETGHVLGYLHEHERNDFVRPSDWIPEGSGCGITGSTVPNTNTAADADSVMVPNQCRRSSHPVSFWDLVGVQGNYGARVAALFPIVSWSKGGVRATGSPAIAVAQFKPDGHKPAFAEGWIWTYSQPPPYGNVQGTQPVTLYKNASTANYALAASASTQSELTAAGFTSAGTIGSVYSAQGNGTCLVPLNTYKLGTVTPPRYATLANPDSQAKAISEGYAFVRTEGYVFTPVPYFTGGYGFTTTVPYHVLAKYIRTNGSTKQDWATVPVGHTVIGELNSKNYNFVQFSGAVLSCAMPGTVPLSIYYSSERDEYYTTTGATAITGYTFKGIVGYVFQSFVSPTVTQNLILKKYAGTAGFFDYDLDSGYAYPAGLTQLTPYNVVSTPGYVIPVTSTGYGG